MKLEVVSCVLVLASVSVTWGHVMFVRTPHGQRSQRDVEEVLEGFESQPSGPPEMTSLHIESNIFYRYAKTTVASRLANKDLVAREITFTAILPQSAFISAFHIEMDGKKYHAYVKEKEAAKKEYSEAVSRGQTAAKVEFSARDSNSFTVSVNVEASVKITFNLTYEELLTRRLGVYSNVINIDPGQIVPDLSVLINIEDSNNLTTLRVPTLRKTNEIDEAGSISNDPLAVIERPAPNKATIRWNPSATQQRELKEDGIQGLLIVEYDIDRQGNPSQILVSEGYFIHFHAPTDLKPLNKHVVFVLDLSGSMGFTKMRQLKEAMTTILSDLKEGDFFSIALFSTGVRIWRPSQAELNVVIENETVLTPDLIVRVTPDNIRIAKEYVDNLYATGGTNINDALMTSLQLVDLGRTTFTAQNAGDESRQTPEPMVIFLTDGQANMGETNPDKIVNGVTQRNSRQAAIFSLAFGRDADKEFLKKLSLKNSAFSRLIYEASDAALQLRDFYRQIASPLLANVEYMYEPNQMVDGTLTNVHFSTLFGGSELVVAGKLEPDSDQVEGVVHAKSFAGQYRYVFPRPITVVLPPRHNLTAPSFMEKMWAYLNIHQLLDKQALEDGGNSTSKDRALALALKYSFVTPLTSLVVVKPNETSNVDAEEAGLPVHKDFLRSGIGYRQMMRPRIGSSASSGRPSAVYSGGVPVGAGYSGPAGHSGSSGFSMPSYPGLSAQGQVDSLSVYPGVGLQAPTLSFPLPPPQHDSSPDADKFVGLSIERRPAILSTTTARTTTTALPPKPLTMNDLSWMTTDSTNRTHIYITKDAQINAYKIAINETNIEFAACTTGTGISGHCRHLPYCVLPAFADDFNLYANSFFCEITGFAGSCCPDDHVSPVSVN